MKKKLLWCMTALTALLTASCTSELALEGAPNNGVAGEEVEVSFSISTQDAQMQTRASGPGKYQTIVGKGQNIDMLIYAVYEKDEETGKLTLLKQYGKGILVDDNHPEFGEYAIAIAAKEAQAEEEKGKDDNGEPIYDTYDGQTILNVGTTFQTEDGVEKITLRLMRNKQYHIAFWAQSSKTKAFKTNDLENVKVVYDNALNNDELRDAFCKVESFSVSPSDVARTVILTRPMAQINVGTSGADYKHILKGKLVYPNGYLNVSKIKLTGVAETINVVTDEIKDVRNEPVTFGWSPLAAYIKKDGGEIPTYDENNLDNLIYVEDEEFLRVDLNNDGVIYRYKTNYPTLDADKNFLTETFKYLSMCYALVPAPSFNETTDVDADGNYKLKDPYTSSVLSKVEVYFAEKGNESDADKLPATMEINSVPVHRNWRTNILGGLKYMRDPDFYDDPDDPDPDPEHPDDPGYPDDPEDPDNPDPDPVTPPNPDPDDPDKPGPDDETSLFNIKTLWIKLDQNYYDEHNGTIGDYDMEDEDYEWKELPEQEEADTPAEDEEGEGTDGGDEGDDQNKG